VCEDPGNDALFEARCRGYAWRGAKPQIASAIERAQQIAATGSSTIAAVAITIALPPR
jgi:hypothetical protein